MKRYRADMKFLLMVDEHRSVGMRWSGQYVVLN